MTHPEGLPHPDNIKHPITQAEIAAQAIELENIGLEEERARRRKELENITPTQLEMMRRILKPTDPEDEK